MVVLGLVVVTAVATGPAATAAPRTLSGTVESGGVGLEGYEVVLARTSPGGPPVTLGSATTDAAGAFAIDLDGAGVSGGVHYVLARSGGLTPLADSVTLATTIGPTLGDTVTVNPPTTVATAYSMAQFLQDGEISGSSLGIRSGTSMGLNLVDPATGAIGATLDSAPNAGETSTRATFNSLANLVAACVASAVDCDAIRTAATPTGGTTPDDSLQALRNVVVEPSNNVVDLHALSTTGPTPYAPARVVAPAAWTLALRFDGSTTGQGMTLEGPGNFALAHDGSMWVALNYTWTDPSDPTANACAADSVARFAPDGSYHPGSPYVGGGLSGAGYGIEIDRHGDVWVSNFGFAAKECSTEPPHTTLSQFTADGTALSPASGYDIPGVNWPQGMGLAPGGDLWVANCAGDSVTVLDDGDPSRSTTLTDLGVSKPFDVAFGSDGNGYVSGTFSNNVAVASPDGDLVRTYTDGFNRPMGVVADQGGRIWVANSGIVDLPCPDKSIEAVLPHSLGFIDPASGSSTTYSGGGLAIPWGISVDGHGNIWISNFGGGRLSAFCGRADSPHCAGKDLGAPLSPDVLGYEFDGLRRATATHADTAGNMWVTNNWQELPTEENPGGYQVVVFLGLAGPVATAAPEPRPAPPAPASGPVVAVPQFTG